MGLKSWLTKCNELARNVHLKYFRTGTQTVPEFWHLVVHKAEVEMVTRASVVQTALALKHCVNAMLHTVAGMLAQEACAGHGKPLPSATRLLAHPHHTHAGAAAKAAPPAAACGEGNTWGQGAAAVRRAG